MYQNFTENILHKNILFIIVYLSFFLDNVLLTVVVPIIPDYLFSNHTKTFSPLQDKYEELEKDNGSLGALLASKAFVQLIFTPIAGFLNELYSYHILLIIGSFNMLLASFLFAYGTNYGMLVLARGLHGSASPMIAISGMALLAENLTKESRKKFMPLAFGGMALGVLIGYPLGGITYQLIGKEAPFLLLALLITINIILQIVFWQNQSNDYRQMESNKIDICGLLNDHQIILTMLAISLATSSLAILEPCVPIWLLVHMKPSPTRWQLGAIFIPDSIGYFIGSHLTSLLTCKSWFIVFNAMVLNGLALYFIPFTTSLLELSIPHFVLGLSVGGIDAILIPSLANLLEQKGSHHYGFIYGLEQLCVSLAYLLGPLIGGFMIKIIGFEWLIRLIGFINLSFAPLLIYLI